MGKVKDFRKGSYALGRILKIRVVAVRDQLNAIMHFAIDALAIVTGALVHGTDFRPCRPVSSIHLFFP